MKNKLKLIVICHLLTVICLSALAQGTAFTYQGRLNTTNGPANGSYNLTFTLFNVSGGGSAVAGPVTNSATAVSNGLFTATLDFGNGVFNGAAYWLELGVGTNGSGTFVTLTPRQKITPTPYAIFSENAAAAVTVASSSVSASSLNTPGAPASGQVLEFNGSSLIWTTPGTTLSAWGLSGNAGTTAGVNFLGTTDNQPLELKVGGLRGLRLEPTGSSYPNVIGGGPSNLASNGVTGVFVGGGVNNIAGHQQTVVGGGYQNHAFGYISTVAGGAYNTADSNESFVGGGAYNTAEFFSAVAGGDLNKAGGLYSVVGGGLINTASGDYSFVGGGSDTSDVSNTLGNIASGGWSAVVGGDGNHASGDDSAVGGGADNTASGVWSTVPGGALNIASSTTCFAAGYRAQAITPGTFVWADNSSANTFSSSANYQFLIRASGGVGIGTSQTPPGGLRVDSGGLAVTGASSPNYAGAAGVFLEKFGTTAGAIYAYNYTAGTPLSLALNSPGGNVGIGTLTPQNTLDVNGIIITGGSDLAEPFKMGGNKIPLGAVVVIDEEHPGQLKMSTMAYDTHVAGIVSGANGIHPGIALEQTGALDGGQNVALTGRVYVLADAAHGAIRPGDLLTTSDTPGHAMKVIDHARAQGAILGKTMTGLSKGKGMVLVLVTLQ
jgi:hypothetical protein